MTDYELAVLKYVIALPILAVWLVGWLIADCIKNPRAGPQLIHFTGGYSEPSPQEARRGVLRDTPVYFDPDTLKQAELDLQRGFGVTVQPARDFYEGTPDEKFAVFLRD